MKVLVIKASQDAMFNKLLHELIEDKEEIVCLLSASAYKSYKDRVKGVSLVDIKNEGFYDINESLLACLKKKTYKAVYITISGTVAHNFGNIIELLDNLSFEKAYFYNSNGDKIIIPKRNHFFDFICECYINLLCWIY